MSVPPVEITDDAKRLRDGVRIHQIAQVYGNVIAVRALDGSHDGTAYPSWKEARRHQPTFYQDLVFPVHIQMDVFTEDSAQRLLNYWRQCFDAGMRAPDPDDFNGQNVEPILPERL